VSRRRDIFEQSPTLKSRDPRFDATVTASNTNHNATDRANKNYSFLSSYQAAEILDLKTQIRKAKDPDMVTELKRQVMSIESKVRLAEAKQQENEILKRHKQKEREAIKSGQKEKPYFLKQSELRRQVLVQRFNSLSKKAREKAMDRKRKRMKGKESKDMPRVRRERDVIAT
jgi:ribosomal RNA-processing protein 36